MGIPWEALSLERSYHPERSDRFFHKLPRPAYGKEELEDVIVYCRRINEPCDAGHMDERLGHFVIAKAAERQRVGNIPNLLAEFKALLWRSIAAT